MKMALTTNNVNAVIQTVTPNMNVGEIQLSADQRNSKEKKLTDAERIRRIVIPANYWGNFTATNEGNASEGLRQILVAALTKIGSDKLRDKLEETPLLREIPLSEFSVANLLAWSEETATSRGSIDFTRKDAEEWFANSSTLVTLTAKWTAAGKNAAFIKSATEMLTNRFGALAAKNHGIAKAEDADKLIAMIDAADAANPVAEKLIGRLTHISKTLTAKANENAITMDDL